MKLIITRHGETEENKAGIIQGHLPGHLSETGIEQAKKVALRLKDEKIDFIYSSDLDRAANTAKEIAKFHPDVPIEFVKDLREKFLGEWQGKSKKELGFTSNTSLVEFFPKDGETSEELFNRASNFLHKILSQHHNDTVVFTAHNGINKAMIAVITGKSPDDIKAIENLHNTSVCVFEIDEDKNHKIHVFNCKKHLD
ncbi:MAG: histidine phosphatase family protein [archaeon]